MASSPASQLTPRKRIRTPRTPRTRQFAVSTTGTDVAHIETIEADVPLRTFPASLVSEIRRYLTDRASNGEDLDLAFARKGNTKLTVNGEGFPTYFVIPETSQKLDAGRYRYGLAKQSPIIVVVQQKIDSTISFNNGQPAIVLYHGKHSSVEGPNKVSKWALWGIDGLRSDTIVWRIAEGAKLLKNADDSDEDTIPKVKEDTETISVRTTPHLVYSNPRAIFREPILKRSRQATPPWHQMDIDGRFLPEDNVPFQQKLKDDEILSPESTLPIDPQLLTYPFDSYQDTPNGHPVLTQTPDLPQQQLRPNHQYLRQQGHQGTGQHRAYSDDFHFFPCTCRGLIVERRNAEMAAATEKILVAGYSGVVTFHFRASINCETRVSKSLEDCRTMAQVFAYGRLHRTILLEHKVISVQSLTSPSSSRRSVYLVMDDVDHWKALIDMIEQELIVREREARMRKFVVCPLELVVLDEGY